MPDKGMLSLVGAGPGDPDLITVKGLQIIADADLILYDALVNKQLLDSNPVAEKHYVGKRKGHHAYTQSEINKLIVSNVQKGKHVVRLKGGDVSVFARATEEIEYASFFGIQTQVIPGISSYSGIAAQHQIPLTRRCKYESIWVTTGHTCKGEISKDLKHAAQSSSTIVILMGMTKIKEIQTEILKYKPENYPVAIVQNGTLPNEKQHVTNLGNLIQDVVKHDLQSPALIIVGPAVVDNVCKLVSTTSIPQLV